MMGIDINRGKRLSKIAIEQYKLDLSGLNVLTEAATGYYVWTPIIAALAGADVYAVTNNSEYGSSEDVAKLMIGIAIECGVVDRIRIMKNRLEVVPYADIVTNLGFVRPINEEMIKLMKKEAVVALMCESWECRASDVDIHACLDNGIAVMGTDEDARGLKIFDYIRHLVAKLIFELNIEIKGSRIGVIGNGYGGVTGERLLKYLGAKITNRIDSQTDLAVIIEPNTNVELLKADDVVKTNPDIKIVHIVGNINKEAFIKNGISVHPSRIVPPGKMSVALDYLGPKPVIDLHTAGLKVGECLARSRINGKSVKEACHFAMMNSPAMRIK